MVPNLKHDNWIRASLSKPSVAQTPVVDRTANAPNETFQSICWFYQYHRMHVQSPPTPVAGYYSPKMNVVAFLGHRVGV